MSEQDEPYTVVVGVSATSKSPTALVWAQAQAEANGGRLIAVRVYQRAHSRAGPSGTSLADPAGPGASCAPSSRRSWSATSPTCWARTTGRSSGWSTAASAAACSTRPARRTCS